MKSETAEVLSIDGREVRVTHPEKPYFSKETKLSKLDLVRYYLSVAPGALAGIRDRPIVLKRFVNGAEGEAFYQKRAPDERPEWLQTVILSFPSGRTAEEIVVTMRRGSPGLSTWAASSYTHMLYARATLNIRMSYGLILIRGPVWDGPMCGVWRWR